MSFGFRKSFSTGPFRFTLSKSGVSSSFGVRGARLTAGPRGTYVTVGSHGFYYRERVGHGRESGPRTSGSTFKADSADDTIRSARVADLVDSSSEKLLADLNRRTQMFNPAVFGWIISAMSLVVSPVSPTPLLLLVIALLALAGAIALQRRHRQAVKTRLFYELDPGAEVRFKAIITAVGALQRCQKLWRVERRRFTSDWKRNAGANSLNNRKCVDVGTSTPPNVECNLQVPTINFGDGGLYFFPDRILVLQSRQFGAVSYEDLQVESVITRFIEDEAVTKDTQIVGRSWRYMNKDGGPDRRFNNNYEIPVVLYGELTLRSSTGLNLVLQTSRPDVANEFQLHIARLRQPPNCSPSARQDESRLDARQKTESQSRATPKSGDETLNQAWQLFGLAPGATSDEISPAYHRLAAMYHPDKVAHLAPEFRLLAEQRMKEINAAYALSNSGRTF